MYDLYGKCEIFLSEETLEIWREWIVLNVVWREERES